MRFTRDWFSFFILLISDFSDGYFDVLNSKIYLFSYLKRGFVQSDKIHSRRAVANTRPRSPNNPTEPVMR